MEGLCGYLPPAFGLGCPVNSSLATDNSDDEASSEKSGNSEDDSRNHYDDGDDLDNNAEEKLKIQREARERFRQVTSTVEVPEKDILAAFARLVETQRETLKRRCFCFFIDGLDEYEENATNRPQRHCESSWQVGQQGQGTIKLCVSTREHNVYMNTFPHAKWLRLHELTYPSRLMAPLGTHGQPPKANVASQQPPACPCPFSPFGGRSGWGPNFPFISVAPELFASAYATLVTMDSRYSQDRTALGAAQLHRRLAPVAAAHYVTPRQEYRGGWPLGYMGADCPADAPSKCTQRYGFTNQNCCPKDQFCLDAVLSIYCCPTESDCKAAVENRPVCANSLWDMYALEKGTYFCCPKGYFGVLPISGESGLCESDINGLPASRIAALITTPTGTATGAGGGTTATRGAGGDSSSSGGSGSGTSRGGDSRDESGGANTIPGALSTSISAGVIAGIVIGSVILLAISFAGILWFHRQSLKKTLAPKPQEAYDAGFPPPAQHQPMTPVPDTPVVIMPPPVYTCAPGQPELGGTQMIEMPTNRT